MTRPSWDDYFMSLAHAAATRSTCSRLSVGAILSRGKRVLSTGYNGSPSGAAHCDHQDDSPCEAAAHAELNALIFATGTEGSTLHVTHAPCFNCSKYIVNAGVRRVVYATLYRESRGLRALADASISIERYSLP